MRLCSRTFLLASSSVTLGFFALTGLALAECRTDAPPVKVEIKLYAAEPTCNKGSASSQTSIEPNCDFNFDITAKAADNCLNDGSKNPTVDAPGLQKLTRGGNVFNPWFRGPAGTYTVTAKLDNLTSEPLTFSIGSGGVGAGPGTETAPEPAPLESAWPTPVRNPSNLGQLIQNIFTWSISIVGFVVFISFFSSGFMWLWGAAGNPTKISQAKEQMWNTLYGALLLFSAYIILRTINPDLVGSGTSGPCDPEKPVNCIPALPNKTALPAAQVLPVANPK